MKFKKSLYTLIIASSALFAYNSLNYVKAEIVDTPSEVPIFSKTESTTTVTTTEGKIKLEDIEPAILMELKPDAKEIVQEKTTVKELETEEGGTIEVKETTTESLKLEDKKVIETVTDEVEIKEIKKEESLPVLEEIELPALDRKPVNNEPVKIEVSSQRIPAGTVIPIKLESPINSIASSIGDQFNATLTSDVIVGDNIVLPAGTVVRGTVGSMKKASFFLKEARILLVFDHIVTPVGKQIPIYAYLTNSPQINYEGYVTGGTSYAKAFKKDANKGRDIIVNTTSFGVEKGLAYLKGFPVVLTAPLCAIGGTLGGGGYIVGKSVYNMFNKGGDVLLEPGTLMNMTLSKALDVPVN